MKVDDSEVCRRQNSMIEVYGIWSSERNTVTNQLSAGYNTFVSAVEEGLTTASVMDNSLVLYDTTLKKITRGLIYNPPYCWGYTSSGLINTTDLFDSKGLIVDEENELLRSKGIKFIAFSNSSKLMHGITLSSRYSVQEVETLTEIPIIFVQGVPGAGKTEYILENNRGKTENLILTVTREARDDMRRRAESKKLELKPERIKTIDSFLVNFSVVGEIDEVWLDEALLVHCGLWSWVMKLSCCRKLYVVGDKAQIPYINRSNLSVNYAHPTDWRMEIKFLKTNYRNPLDIVYWLQSKKFYDFNVNGTSNVFNSVKLIRIGGPGELPSRNNLKYLTFTQGEKSALLSMGLNVNTIHEYQGSQSDNIAVVRLNTKEADIIYKSKPHILVALTRHRKTFIYFTVKTDDLLSAEVLEISKYGKNNMLSVKLDLTGGSDSYRYEKPDMSCVLYKEDKTLRNILINNGGNSYIPWYFGVKRKFNETVQPEITEFSRNPYVLQDFLDRILPGSSVEFREHDHLSFEHSTFPIEITGCKVSLAFPIYKKYDRLTAHLRTPIQYPLHQSQKISLKAYFERNGNVPQLQGLHDAVKEARLLLKDFKKLCPNYIDFTKNQIVPNLKSLAEWVSGQPPAVLKIIKSEELFIDQNFDLYSFIIKAIPKIDMEVGAEFRYKAPQTIAFQSKTINSVFCPLLKDMMDRIEYSLHDDIILYNNMSPNEFAEYFTDSFPSQRYRKLSKFIEIDFSKYDKSQGLVILIFEAFLMEAFGIPYYYIALWIIMHRYTTVRDRVNNFSAKVEYQRKSGDAGTWRLNTTVQIAILNRILRLYERIMKRKVVACFSGDDSLIFIDEDFHRFNEKILKLQYVYNLEAKVMNYKVPYFCSKFLLLVDDHWIFVPDTLKLIIKLGRNDLVDEEHIECYRISFSDNLYYYKFRQYWPYISFAINDRYKLKGEHDIIFESLLSVVKKPSQFFEFVL
uniref:Putative RNA-dependent RNA-polymerase n=1 Tax=Mill Lade virus TaxID=2511041 RepID=A0A411D380_9VIRU|nr:putative RNA-dependent RNA-polymerase [Mill Lade virus]